MGLGFDTHMSATGMWVEKYRPKEISEIVGQTEIIGSLKGCNRIWKSSFDDSLGATRSR